MSRTDAALNRVEIAIECFEAQGKMIAFTRSDPGKKFTRRFGRELGNPANMNERLVAGGWTDRAGLHPALLDDIHGFCQQSIEAPTYWVAEDMVLEASERAADNDVCWLAVNELPSEDGVLFVPTGAIPTTDVRNEDHQIEAISWAKMSDTAVALFIHANWPDDEEAPGEIHGHVNVGRQLLDFPSLFHAWSCDTARHDFGPIYRLDDDWGAGVDPDNEAFTIEHANSTFQLLGTCCHLVRMLAEELPEHDDPWVPRPWRRWLKKRFRHVPTLAIYTLRKQQKQEQMR